MLWPDLQCPGQGASGGQGAERSHLHARMHFPRVQRLPEVPGSASPAYFCIWNRKSRRLMFLAASSLLHSTESAMGSGT